MRVGYRVQHAAGRTEPLARLMAGMPAETVAVTDESARTDPNPWRNYQRCLRSLLQDEGLTHGLVIQDDCIVCRNFDQAVERLVAARPDDVLSLFVGGLRSETTINLRLALRAGQRWSPLGFRDIAHVIAIVWPMQAVSEFLAWSDTATLPGYPRLPRSDDAIFGTWLRATRRTCWACVPSLVEHPDDVPTLIHQRERARAGDDKGRVAERWIGTDEDPLLIDWSV